VNARHGCLDEAGFLRERLGRNILLRVRFQAGKLIPTGRFMNRRWNTVRERVTSEYGAEWRLDRDRKMIARETITSVHIFDPAASALASRQSDIRFKNSEGQILQFTFGAENLVANTTWRKAYYSWSRVNRLRRRLLRYFGLCWSLMREKVDDAGRMPSDRSYLCSVNYRRKDLCSELRRDARVQTGSLAADVPEASDSVLCITGSLLPLRQRRR